MAKGRIEKGDIVAEGILKDFNQDLKTATDNVNLLTTALKAVQETGKALKKGVSTVKPKDVKTIQEFNSLTAQSNQNAKNRLQIDKSLLTEKAKIAQLTREQNKAIKTEVALGDKQINTLEKLRARNAAIKIEKDKVNFSTKKGQEAIRKLNAELDKNNKVLQKNASALGKQKMNIGNYKSAISGLRSGLAQLGLSMGVFQILKGSFNIVKDFEQGQADLASVLGINVDQMAALTEQAKLLGATTTFTASQVSELQKEYAKLGFSMSEIENVTEATLLLAEATGTDLGRAAEVTGATLRGFGLSATDTQRVVDVMAKSFSSSSLDMEKFATAMSAVAPVAKAMGFSIEETTSMLGTLTDSGLDASTAGTSLRNMMLEAKKQGLSWNEALDKVNNSQDKASTSLELFGKRGVAAGIILAENQDTVAGLTDKLLESDDAAKKMAETQRNTLGGAIKLLTSAWEGWILKINEAGGAGDKLKRSIQFLADNFETIVYWIGMGVKAFIAFKVSMKAMQLSSFVRKLGGVSGAFKEIGRGAKSSVSGIQGMGKALSGIGWVAIIGLALELANTFIDVATGADIARVQLEKLQEIEKISNDRTNSNIDILKKEIELEEKRLRILVAKGELTESQAEDSLKLFITPNKESEGFTDKDGVRVKNYAKEVSNLIAIEQSQVKLAEFNIAAFKKAGEFKNRLLIGEEKALIKNSEIQIETLRNFTTELENQKFELEVSTTEFEKFGRNKIKVLTDESKVRNESVIPSIELETKTIEELAEAWKELRLRRDETTDGMSESLDDAFMSGLTRNVLEAEYNILIADVNQTEEERINLLTRQIIARAELEKYGKTEAEQQVINARMLKSINELTEKEVKSTVDNTKLVNDAIDLTTQYFIANADKRIAKINEEIDAATKQADHYRTLAENGNITAKESLAEQNRLIAEANLQKEKEEKRKEQILMVSAVLKSFNSYLDAGDDPATALAKSFTTKELISQFIGAMPTFLEGTEDTGTNGRGIDGKGGFNAVLHPNERVMTKEQNAMIGGVSNDYVAQVMEQHRVGNYMDGGLLIAKLDNAEIVNGLSSLQSEMKDVKKAILNQPRESNNTAEMLSNYMMFENKQTQGGKTTTSRFKVKK